MVLAGNGPKGKTGNGWFVCFSFPIKITRQRRETNACFYFNVKKSTRSLPTLTFLSFHSFTSYLR